MKKLATIIVGTLILNSTQGQISIVNEETGKEKFKVGKVGSFGNFHSEIEGKIIESDTLYFLTFNNMKYKTITDLVTISFSSEDNTLENLFVLLSEFYLPENAKNKEYLKQFRLGDKLVTAKNTRSMGTTGIFIMIEDDYFILYQPQLKKLFGKK